MLCHRVRASMKQSRHRPTNAEQPRCDQVLHPVLVDGLDVSASSQFKKKRRARSWQTLFSDVAGRGRWYHDWSDADRAAATDAGWCRCRCTRHVESDVARAAIIMKRVCDAQ